MVTLMEFESLHFRRFFPEAREFSAAEGLGYDLEYMGGQYDFLDVPGVHFGYGKKTHLRPAYIECTSQGDDAEIRNARAVLQSIGFPYTLGDLFPALQDAARHFTDLKYRTNPYIGALS